jgi:serine/threonine protein kinase
MLNAINECHLNNVIHCDIKPQNFLIFNTAELGCSLSESLLDEQADISIDSYDPNCILKMTDFGLSHYIPHGMDKAFMKFACGTFPYRAPEIRNVSQLFTIGLLCR